MTEGTPTGLVCLTRLVTQVGMEPASLEKSELCHFDVECPSKPMLKPLDKTAIIRWNLWRVGPEAKKCDSLPGVPGSGFNLQPTITGCGGVHSREGVVEDQKFRATLNYIVNLSLAWIQETFSQNIQGLVGGS